MADDGRFLGLTGAWPAPDTAEQGWPVAAGPPAHGAAPDDTLAEHADPTGARRPASTRTIAPPLQRVPLPAATVVRLPAPALVRVTPLVARSIVEGRALASDAHDGTSGPGVADDVSDAWAYRSDDRPSGGTAAPLRQGATAAAAALDDAYGAPAVASDTPEGPRGATSAGDTGRWIGGERLPADVRVLRDRLPHGCRVAVDQVLIASSGVWVVAVETGSRVELQHDRRRASERRLLVGGRDRTDRVTSIGLAAHEVRKIAARHDVPIHSAVCVVGGERSLLATGLRLHGVWVSGPRRLLDMVQQPGALDDGDVETVANLLDARLRPA